MKDNQGDRDTWVKGQLASIPSGWSIIDVGCGEQRYRNDCSHLRYVAQDFGKYEAKEKTGLVRDSWKYGPLDITSDITSIPVNDQAFDAVLCTEVLEHVPDPVVALRELTRILKIGGRLLLTAPFNSVTHFAPYHFCTGFGPSFYRHHLNAMGFGIEQITPNGNYFDVLAAEFERLPDIQKQFANDNRVPDWTLPWHLLYAAFTDIPIKILEKLSEHDRGSAGLSCYGYHVLARRER